MAIRELFPLLPTSVAPCLRPNPIFLLTCFSPNRIPFVSRPSIKITRHDDRPPPLGVAFEVWNPITASYEPMASLNYGLTV
jgi:hypothetical protein